FVVGSRSPLAHLYECLTLLKKGETNGLQRALGYHISGHRSGRAETSARSEVPVLSSVSGLASPESASLVHPDGCCRLGSLREAQGPQRLSPGPGLAHRADQLEPIQETDQRARRRDGPAGVPPVDRGSGAARSWAARGSGGGDGFDSPGKLA